MGSLTPGAKYIYERSDGVVYAREFGADPSTRRVVGYESGVDYAPLINGLKEDKLWDNIRRAAKTNPALNDLLEQAKVMYNLTKSNE